MESPTDDCTFPDFNGFVCRVTFDKPVLLTWNYGGVWWKTVEKNANQVTILGQQAQITEPNLPNGLPRGMGRHRTRTGEAAYGQQAEFVSATPPRRVYHIVGTGASPRTTKPRARQTMARLDTPNASPVGRNYATS